MRYLVIRFRQIGDAILATCIFNTIRANDPDADTTFVLNERIEPLFRNHPSIDHIITFTEEERHSPLVYARKIWRIVHRQHYDVIIDMRSTVNTMIFALMSHSSRYRIGAKKKYTHLAFNYFYPKCGNKSMIAHNLDMLAPLGFQHLNSQFTLFVTDEERQRFGEYLRQQGVSSDRPLILMGVTAKLADKRWRLDYMADITRRIIRQYPDVQLIFNYAPGNEEAEARKLYDMLEHDPHIFIDVQAHSPRELSVMTTFVDFYFGNEGGARHIAQAHGKPSFVIVAPQNNPRVWIPQNETPAGAISIDEILSPEQRATLPQPEQYEKITPDLVWQRLTEFMNRYGLLVHK
ncbi:MAG: glycosyltransferase family 9 protein [Prevotella sp.]|jgi:heptosyltransferase-2